MDNLLNQIIVGFAHLLWDISFVHTLSKLIGLDHPVNTTDTLAGMDLHLERISNIFPSLGDLSNLLCKGIQPDRLLEQLSIRILGTIPTLLLHPFEGLGLVHHLKELLQKSFLGCLLLLGADGPVASSNAGLNDVVEATGTCPGSDPLFPGNRLPGLCGFADRTVERIVLEDASQKADLDIDREWALRGTAGGLDPEGTRWLLLIRLLLLDDRRLL
jgi:hypothetical protein